MQVISIPSVLNYQIMNIFGRVTQVPTLKTETILKTVRFASFGQLSKHLVTDDLSNFKIRGTREKQL